MKSKLQLSRVGVTICLVIATLLYSIGPHATFSLASQGPCWVASAMAPTSRACACSASLQGGVMGSFCPPTAYNTIGFTICDSAQTGSTNCVSTQGVIGSSFPCTESYNYQVIAGCYAAYAACTASCAVIGPACLICLGAFGAACYGCAVRNCTTATTGTTLYASIYTPGTLTGSCPPPPQ